MTFIVVALVVKAAVWAFTVLARLPCCVLCFAGSRTVVFCRVGHDGPASTHEVCACLLQKHIRQRGPPQGQQPLSFVASRIFSVSARSSSNALCLCLSAAVVFPSIDFPSLLSPKVLCRIKKRKAEACRDSACPVAHIHAQTRAHHQPYPHHTMPKIPSMKGSGIESNRCLQATVKCTVRSPSLPACVLAVILVATFTCFVIRPLWIRNELLVFGQERMVAEHLSTLWGNTKAKHDEDAFLSKREALRQQVQNNGDKHAWVTSVASGTANLLFFKETTASRPCDALVPCLLDEQKAWFWVALYQGSSHHLLNWPVLSDATPYASVG